jgi:CheY-like chemotaxis protein
MNRGLTTADEINRVVELESHDLHCPQCSRAVEEKFSVCPYCRHQLQNLCESCGASLNGDWTICPYCRKARDLGEAASPPAQAISAAPEAQPPRVAPSLGAIDVPEVLIVDDSEVIRRIVRLTLEHAARPLRCDEASNGYEALGKIEAHPPHLIVLDLMMPGMDGIEVCKRLRAKLSTAFIPIIMLTALGDAGSKEMSFLAGTDDYLTKPFERQDLIARVVRLLERTYGWGRLTAAA